MAKPDDEEEPTPDDEAEEFGDTDTADAAKSEAEKADPDDMKNTP